jgi:hypothetical protein
MHADTFHVAGAQCAPAVHKSTLHDRCMADELIAVPSDRMHPADGVLPVDVRHLAVEDDIEQVARCSEHSRIDIGSVADLEIEPSVAAAHVCGR